MILVLWNQRGNAFPDENLISGMSVGPGLLDSFVCMNKTGCGLACVHTQNSRQLHSILAPNTCQLCVAATCIMVPSFHTQQWLVTIASMKSAWSIGVNTRQSQTGCISSSLMFLFVYSWSLTS